MDLPTPAPTHHLLYRTQTPLVERPDTFADALHHRPPKPTTPQLQPKPPETLHLVANWSQSPTQQTLDRPDQHASAHGQRPAGQCSLFAGAWRALNGSPRTTR